MATTVRSLYAEVCLIMLEDYGFDIGTGLFTDQMFLDALIDVLQDYLDRVGGVKKIINILVTAGTATYTEPNTAATVQSAALDQTFIYRDSGQYMDNTNSRWNLATGRAFRWREDENPPQTIQVTPIPDVSGYAVNVPTPFGYGTVSATSTVVDFNITASGSGYGTISDASTGAVYLETLDLGYGTISSMVSSTGNLQMISTVTPVDNLTLADYVPLIPDSFIPFCKYGIVAKLFTADSGARDVQRAMYANARFTEGLRLFGSIMDEQAIGQGE